MCSPNDVKFISDLFYTISSVESQKGVYSDQKCSVENQKGVNAIDFVQH